MEYVDASVIVATLVPEAHSERADRLLSDPDAVPHISDWTITEVASALAMKVRMGLLTADQHTAAAAQWRKSREESFTRLPVTTAHFDSASSLLDRTDLNLRAGDALHLAIAADHKLRLLTLDTRMADAAVAMGVAAAV